LIADTLNSFTESNVQALHDAISNIYLRDGQAIRHNYEREGFLIVDIDLTGLPASKHAEGSKKGYFRACRRTPLRVMGYLLASFFPLYRSCLCGSSCPD